MGGAQLPNLVAYSSHYDSLRLLLAPIVSEYHVANASRLFQKSTASTLTKYWHWASHLTNKESFITHFVRFSADWSRVFKWSESLHRHTLKSFKSLGYNFPGVRTITWLLKCSIAVITFFINCETLSLFVYECQMISNPPVQLATGVQSEWLAQFL